MKTNQREQDGNQQEIGISREEFTGRMREYALEALMKLASEEVESLCGGRHERGLQREFFRAGNAPSYVRMEERRVDAQRPRVRRRLANGGSEEVDLDSWKVAQSPDEFEAAVQAAVLGGVSHRRVSEVHPEAGRGSSRSSVSRLWQKEAARLVGEMQQSDLSGFDLVVLMLDAVVLTDGLVVTVALGIDTEGTKQVLGFRVGPSENAEVAKDLMSGLLARGLRLQGQEGDRGLLVVLDGSKALKSAVLEVMPSAVIQRCLVHKERNLRGYLGRKHWGELAKLFNRLRRAQGAEDGREALNAIEDFLSDKNAQAQESLAEAAGELLAVHELGVPNTLHPSLLSTNCIENTFKNLRRHIGRVSRWRKDSKQADLWLASGLSLAQRGFRKIKGHAKLQELVQALAIKKKAY